MPGPSVSASTTSTPSPRPLSPGLGKSEVPQPSCLKSRAVATSPQSGPDPRAKEEPNLSQALAPTPHSRPLSPGLAKSELSSTLAWTNPSCPPLWLGQIRAVLHHGCGKSELLFTLLPPECAKSVPGPCVSASTTSTHSPRPLSPGLGKSEALQPSWL